jgi:hypothetical protein
MKWWFSSGYLVNHLLSPAEDSLPPHYFEFSLVTLD